MLKKSEQYASYAIICIAIAIIATIIELNDPILQIQTLFPMLVLGTVGTLGSIWYFGFLSWANHELLIERIEQLERKIKPEEKKE